MLICIKRTVNTVNFSILSITKEMEGGEKEKMDGNKEGRENEST